MDYVVSNKYLVGPKIGNGSSADVFLGTNVQSNEEVAMKMESIKTKLPQLKFESKLYKILNGGPGIVNTRWYGAQGQYRVLVMDLLGPSLEDLKNFCSRKFRCSKVELARLSLKITYACGPALYTLKGFPASRRKTWEFPDWAWETSKLEQSRRDDLESLGYVLVYLLNGRAFAIVREEKHAKIKKMKMDMCAEALCEDLPLQFAKFIRIAWTLLFEFDPNYEAYKKLYQDCLIEEGFGRDYIYDWTIIHYATADVPRTFNGVIPPCSERCGGSPPPPLTFEPPMLGHPDPPRPPLKKVQIPQRKAY